MKKFLSLLLAAVMLLSLSSALAETTTLTIWESGDSAMDFMRAAAEKYMETHPDVSFEFQAVGNADAVQKLELDGPTGTGPDLFAAPHDKLGQMITGELIVPNSNPDEVNNNFVGAASRALTSDGKLWGYPVAVETYALFYNKALIAEAPKTWEEIIAFAKEYNNPAEDKYAILWEVAAPYYNYQFLSAYGADLFGPEGNDPAAHNINTPEAKKGMEFFATLKDALLPVNASDISGDFVKALFIDNAKAAMFITGPWSVEEIKKAGLNVGVTTLPRLPGNDKPATSFSGVRGLFVSAFSEKKEAAQDFANFLLTKEMQELRYEITKTIPARKDITIEDEMHAGILAQAEYAKPMPSIRQMDGYWSAMAAAFANIWNGADIQAELDAAAQAVEAIK